MTRRNDWTQAYAIVRRDRWPGMMMDPDDTSPPQPCGGEFSFTVKEVVLSLDAARREVERLDSLADVNTRYFWTGTRLFHDGGSFGEPSPNQRGGDRP